MSGDTLEHHTLATGTGNMYGIGYLVCCTRGGMCCVYEWYHMNTAVEHSQPLVAAALVVAVLLLSVSANSVPPGTRYMAW